MRLTIRFDGVILSEAKNPVRDQDISKANDSAVRLNICRRSFRKSMSFALANQVYTPSATPPNITLSKEVSWLLSIR